MGDLMIAEQKLKTGIEKNASPSEARRLCRRDDELLCLWLDERLVRRLPDAEGHAARRPHPGHIRVHVLDPPVLQPGKRDHGRVVRAIETLSNARGDAALAAPLGHAKSKRAVRGNPAGKAQLTGTLRQVRP